jgi:hypothetical protein
LQDLVVLKFVLAMPGGLASVRTAQCPIYPKKEKLGKNNGDM